MPYYCPSHTAENASKPFSFISHNTFWMYGFVEHPVGEASWNCPEEFDVWEMGGQNWHITGDERLNPYTNASKYASTCTGPFDARAKSAAFLHAPAATAVAAPPATTEETAACPGGFIVSGAGSPELNGCYEKAAPYHGTPRYTLAGAAGLFANASIFKYPQYATDPDTSNWLWRIGTIKGDQGTVDKPLYSAPCPTAKPMQFGWAKWGGTAADPPPTVHAGAGSELSSTCPAPTGKPPGAGAADCSKLAMQTYVVEWREDYARVYVDGTLKSEFSTPTYSKRASLFCALRLSLTRKAWP